MKNFKLLLIFLSLCFILLGIVILLQIPPDEKPLVESADDTATLEEERGLVEEQPEIKDEIRFDLKYDKYLVAEPYEYEENGVIRTFQFKKMVESLKTADLAFEKGKLTYVDNYKNQNGYAPYYQGKSVDEKGTSRSASAPGYIDLADMTRFIYIPDGTLVRILEEAPEFTKLALVEDDSEYFVPSKYVRDEYCLTDLNHAIVVDRENQNIASFEKRVYETNGHKTRKEWTVVSYSFATTGKVGRYHQPTPLGYFYAIEKRERFYYLKDGTNEIEGYAPYAIRFTAGAYVHGIATAYKYMADGSRRDPGIKEFSDSIGTIPLSHKCVRNYTSHAKFLYDWYVHGQTVVVVI